MIKGDRRKRRVLVIEDDARWRAEVEALVRREGCNATSARTVKEGLQFLQQAFFDLVVLDWFTPEMNGDEFLPLARTYSPATFVIVYSAMDDADRLAAAHGADDFVLKNARNMAGLRYALQRASDRKDDRARLLVNEATVDRCPTPIGDSAAMREVRGLIEEAASCDLPVLIEGETGTGKELVARAIHGRSPRSKGRLLTKNCAMLGGELLNSDLFGHVKGAFTGAAIARPGLFELASGGTVFLDEIVELGPEAQARLLRVVEEGMVQRVGTHADIPIDVRIIAATNRHLEREVERERFRSDLLHRLNVLRIPLPCLSDHRDDIEMLVGHFLRLHGGEHAVQQGVDERAMEILRSRDYPGNVRELENLVRRAVVKARTATITLEHLQLQETGVSAHQVASLTPIRISYAEALSRFELAYYQALLEDCEGNISQAARISGISRTHFHRKLNALGIRNAVASNRGLPGAETRPKNRRID